MRRLAIDPRLKRPTGPTSSSKTPKQSVLYVLRPETEYTCEKCLFKRDEAKKCALFAATDNIKPSGSCGFWIHFNPEKAGSDFAPIGAVTKEEAGYMDSKNGFSCKRCEYFDPNSMDCSKVDKNSDGDTPGEIHPNACCNRFEPDDKRGNMTTDQLIKLFAPKA